MLLAGDIGGTKTNLAIFSREEGLRAPLAEETFQSSDYANLETLARGFVTRVGLQVAHASFGVAGPVVGGRATITNLPWVIDEMRLRETLDIPSVRLLNDLAAIASFVPFLESEDLYTLNEGQAEFGGAMAVIAPGTGLGEAYLVWDGSRYNTFPSEGGHTDFAPTNPLEFGLLSHLLKRFDRVSYERVCSGRGLPHIYAYLKESGHADEPGWLKEQLARVEDPNPIIVNSALAGKCELCVTTLNMFVSILGAEAGNLALKVLATGGVYLGGGIPPRILPALQQGRLLQAFTSKGRFSDLLARTPVHVILNRKSALLGAACHGLELER
jgi:glucokinase